MNDLGISKPHLKRRNRMQLLNLVREQGPISRVDISAILGITLCGSDDHHQRNDRPAHPGRGRRRASEPQRRGPQVGRRKILLDINETYKFAVAHLRGRVSEVSIGLTTLNAAALDKQLIAHEGDMTPEKLVSLLDDILEKMLQNSCLSRENLLGIGVGIMPSAYEMMGLEEGTETCPVFPALQKALEDSMNLPVYINSAVMEFAMAGLHYNEIHAKAENQVFLYWDSGSYHAIPINGNTPLLAAAAGDAFIERLCVDPDGRAMEGYPRGSVRAELSAEAVADKIRPVFSEENTPALFAALNGDLSRLTPASLLTAAETDQPLQEIAAETVKKFCVMLQALHCLYAAEHVNLYGFGFTPEHLELIRKTAEEFAGEAFAQSILLCPIGDRYHFLSGCTYIIQAGFYQRGGLV